MINLPTLPAEALVDRVGRVTTNWLRWLVDVLSPVYQFGVRQASDPLKRTGLTASLASTDVVLATAGFERFRVGIYAKLSRAAGATSSLQVHVRWTDTVTGTAMTWNSPTISGNVLTEVIQAYVPVEAKSVTVSTTYASTGAPAMEYYLVATAEALPR